MTQWKYGWCMVAVGLLVSGGCSHGPARRHPPQLDPVEAAAKAIAEFDSNADALLEPAEFKKCPSIKMVADEIDDDNDGKLSADEIANRIRSWGENKVAMVALTCAVKQNDSPLSGAVVSFVPESFLGPNLKTASGTTDARGYAEISIEGETIQGAIQCGFYRVSISKIENGKETIDPKFNQDTILGEEIRENSARRKEGIVYNIDD